jgi:hypothetical protein
MIELEVRPERSGYASHEEVAVIVRIVNNQNVAIEIPDPNLTASPQPVYSLLSPGRQTPVSFSNLSHMRGIEAQAITSDPKDAKLMTIERGESWSGVFALDSFVDLSAPGSYRLSAKLDWLDVKAESKEVDFQIRPVQISSIHIGLGVRPFEHAEGEGAFIQGDDNSGQLYAFTFQEVRPSIGEAIVRQPIHRLELGAGATDVAVPWRNSPFFDEMLRWIVWREGSTIKALSSASDTPVVCAFPAKSCYIVRPPLKSTDGPLDVLVVSPDQNELSLIRFNAKLGDENDQGFVAWKAALPSHPVGIVAALAPDGSRHVALTARSDSGFSVFHSRFSSEGSIGSFRSIRVEKAQPLETAAPSLFVDSQGNAHVGVLAFTDDKGESCVLAEAFFPTGDKSPRYPGIVDLGVLPERPLGGAVLYVDKDGAVGRREVVVELSQHRLLKLDETGELVPVSNPGVPTTPILLAPGKNTTYVLYTDANRGFYLEPL